MADKRTLAVGGTVGDSHTDPALRVLMRTLFYKSSWSKLLNGNLIIGVALILSMSLNIIQFVFRPKPDYFAITEDGRIIRLVPLSEPMVNSDTVLQFTQKTITKSFSLDFDPQNLRDKLQSLRGDYTKDGYSALLAQMDSSGLIEKIRSRRLVSSAVATGAPVVSREFVENGIYTWEAQMPVSLTLTGQNERKSYDFLFIVNVQRIPTVDNARGIAISSMRIDNNPKIN